MSRVLVTGGAGFIGSHLCERLIEEGHEVWVIDCFDDYYPPSIKWDNLKGIKDHERFRLLEGDLCDQAWLESVIGGQEFSIVYHLAARPGISGSVADPLRWAQMNTIAMLSLLETLRRGPATRFVFASSSSVYGDRETVPFQESAGAVEPKSPYAALKRSNELLLHTYHHLYQIPILCLRYFTVYGPRQRPEMAISWFTRAITRGDTIQLFGDGSSQRDYSYVDDIVNGSLAARDLDFSYEILNLGGSTPTMLNRLIEIIEGVVGKRAVIEHLPARREELTVTCADMRQAAERLGYDPQVGIEQGVARYYEWYRDHDLMIEEALQSLSAG